MSKLRVSVGEEKGENLSLYKGIEARRTHFLEIGGLGVGNNLP